jgi:ABC-type phosphate/phosphonate transport system ATPase subunit
MPLLQVANGIAYNVCHIAITGQIGAGKSTLLQNLNNLNNNIPNKPVDHLINGAFTAKIPSNLLREVQNANKIISCNYDSIAKQIVGELYNVRNAKQRRLFAEEIFTNPEK